MKKPEDSKIRISVATPLDTTSWEFGRSLLELLCEVDLRLFPERVDNLEPIKKVVSDIEDCEQYWAPEAVIDGPYGRSFVKWDFLWKRTKAVKSLGQVIHTARNKAGKLNLGWITLTATADRKVNWSDLFSGLCVLTQPKFATLHLLTPAETRPGAFGEANDASFATNDFLCGHPGVALETRGISNLAWATHFGGEYAVEVNVEMLRAHGFFVEQVGQGYSVFVTSEISDVVKDFAVFSDRRAELKELFRPGLFRMVGEPTI
ncbi:hypothetical protein [Ralstonia solanacearum]|uniref:hypothetical protein n=1 Tax=Ralstonia solanacearum TaxID=305 RepID=UPI000A5B64EA|nr:hypothetical protein [Ralstonia solanacearum]